MIIVAFGDITDTWNVSIYIHNMDMTTIEHQLWKKPLKNGRWGWAAHFWDNRKRPCLPAQKRLCSFLSLPTYHLNIIVYTTKTLSQIKSQEFISHIKQHFITTSHLTYVANGNQVFVKYCIKSGVHFDLHPNNMLFGRLQPSVVTIHTVLFRYVCNKKSRYVLLASW